MPELLLLDEPENHLDIESFSRKQFQAMKVLYYLFLKFCW